MSRRLLPLVLAPLLATACLEITPGGDDDPSDRPGDPVPDIVVSASSLVMPPTPVGSETSATIGIRNRGLNALQLTDLEVIGDGAFSVSLPAALQLDPGDATDLVVTFQPDAVPEAQATLVISSNDPDEPEVEVALSGEGTGAEAAAADMLDLGTVAPGCETSGAAVIENVGTMPLTVTAASVDAPFELDETGLPAVLSAGEALALPVRYAPTEPIAAVAGQLRVETDAGDLSVTVLAAQDPSTWTEDAFVASDGQTDVLFAVDRSCSMADDVQALVSAMPGFTAELDARGLDWRVSLTVDDDGCINGPDLFIDDTFSAADVVSTTEQMIALGSSYASNTERAFTLMETAVAESAAGGCNPGMVRSSATLNLVGVSDEPEQSPQSWSHFVSLFQALKTDPADVAMHAIADAGACGASGTTGFQDAAAATDGVILDICGDMATNMVDLADAIVAADPGTYPLSATPVEDTLTVTVEGASVSGWTYDAAAQEVVFDAASTPAAGESVSVEYVEDACP